MLGGGQQRRSELALIVEARDRYQRHGMPAREVNVDCFVARSTGGGWLLVVVGIGGHQSQSFSYEAAQLLLCMKGKLEEQKKKVREDK